MALVRRRRGPLAPDDQALYLSKKEAKVPVIRLGRPSSSSSLVRPGTVPRRRHTTEAKPIEDVSGAGDVPKYDELFSRAMLSKDMEHYVSSTSEAFACQMALKHRLMLSEVRRIMKEFLGAQRNDDGGLGRSEFDKVLGRIFDVEDVDEQVGRGAYRASGAEVKVDLELFLDWYVQNMFTQVNALNAAPEKKESEKLVYEIARKHGVSTLVVDKVKTKFDHFDTNKSGMISWEEFQDMFCTILKTCRADLNPKRMERFWKEIDHNNDGGVDFSEFAQWYLKYFNPDVDVEDFDMAGPLQTFYDSYDPQVQRRNSLRGIAKFTTIH